MNYSFEFPNGLKVVLAKMEGFFSVSCGIMVKTGSINETERENGISHFIEHTVFKGTEKRSSFEISDFIDRIGASINAYTSKETTCYYTKSTSDHLYDSLEVLSDIFFNSKFDEEELEKEKGVVIEEINMCEDTPEELCLDLLAESKFGKIGLGQTILGSEKNVKSFTKSDIKAYMQKYYTADNVVVSIAGGFDLEKAKEYVKELFAEKFDDRRSCGQFKQERFQKANLFKTKKIEQSHVAFSLNGITLSDERGDVFNIANTVLGGGMSSRLFQRIREELGLCYSVYSYLTQYKDTGVLEIYAGVNTKSRNTATQAVIEEIKKFKKDGVTESEFLRGKEQIKSAFIMSRESTISQMLLYGRYMLFFGEEFGFEDRMKKIECITHKDVSDIINEYFDVDDAASATVGSMKSPLKF